MYDPNVARRVGVDPDHAAIETYGGMMEYLGTERHELLGPPGRYFSYSNEAFGLLGAVVERVSGRPFEAFLDNELLRPAGMCHTTFDTGVMRRFPEVTVLYSPDRTNPRDGLVASEEWWEDTCLRAAGGLRTNVDDLLRYLEIFLRDGRVGRERIVAARTVGRMLRPAIEIRPGQWYGYGIFVRPDYHGTPLGYHSGGLKGVSSEIVVLPHRGIGGVVLSNAEQVPAPRVVEGAINRLAQLPLTTPFVEIPPSVARPTSLREYGGWYGSGEGIWARVTPHRNHLRLDFKGIEVTMQGLRLRPIGHDRFVVRIGGETGYLPFLRDRDRRVWAAALGWRIVRKRELRDLRLARRGRLRW